MREKRTSFNGQGLEFYGSKWVSFLPLLIFLGFSLYLAISNANDVRGMWVGAVIGLMVTVFFARDKGAYAERVIDGMADRLGLLSMACWFFAGVFAAILRAGGLVKGLVWLAYNLRAQGALFVLVSFLASSVFATATGTGLGTIIAGMSVLYPAGIVMGANPLLLAGSIIGGGALGDNIAAISDTTICSAATQGADIPGVVRSRFKYTLLAACASVLLILLWPQEGNTLVLTGQAVADFMDIRGLSMLVPAIITVFLAWRRWHIIPAVTVGILIAVLTAHLFGLSSLSQLVFVEGGKFGGIIIEGLAGVVDVSILAILIMGCVGIMQAGGGDKALMGILSFLVKTPKEAEFFIVFVTLFFSTLMGLNTPSVLAAGVAFVNPLGKRFKIHPYRRANLLDATACTLVYALPWAPTVLMAQELSARAAREYGSFIPVLAAKEIVPHVFYCYILLAIMIISVCFGWGHRREED